MTRKFTLAGGKVRCGATATAGMAWYRGVGGDNLSSLTSAIGGSLSPQIASARPRRQFVRRRWRRFSPAAAAVAAAAAGAELSHRANARIGSIGVPRPGERHAPRRWFRVFAVPQARLAEYRSDGACRWRR